jgi:outer membrane immunogenic protein
VYQKSDVRLLRQARGAAAAAVALVASATAGYAADLVRQDAPRRTYAPQPYPPPQSDLPRHAYTARAPLGSYSWTGPYIGGTLGYQWGHVSRSDVAPAGLVGGIQGGYNWQFGQLVVGVEADVTGSDARDQFAGWKFSNPWFGTVRGRIGFALDRVLLYGTLGFAIGGIETELGGASETGTHVGWTAGGGVEVGLTSNWSMKVEYLYVDLANRPYALTGLKHGYASDILRIGVNYRF